MAASRAMTIDSVDTMAITMERPDLRDILEIG